jgi:HSP20 family protein
MTDMTRRDAFQGMTSLQDAMNQLLTESFVRSSGWAGSSQLPLDLYETENEYVAKLAVPGLKPENFEITMQQNVLVIRGHTQNEQQEGVRYHVQEQRFGTFNRSIQFPTAVDDDKIQATLADGILTLRLPKSERAKPKRITIKAS